jgi:thioredoxin 1
MSGCKSGCCTPEVKKKSNTTDNKVKSSKKVKEIFMFSAVWCRPCQLIKPLFKQLKEKYTGLKFTTLDVDDPKTDDVPSSEQVTGVPTFQFFKDGKMISTFSGANQERLETEVIKLRSMK